MKIFVIQEDKGDYQYNSDVLDYDWMSDKKPFMAFKTREKASEYIDNNWNGRSDLCVEIHEIELVED